jgi:hypothetical protein
MKPQPVLLVCSGGSNQEHHPPINIGPGGGTLTVAGHTLRVVPNAIPPGTPPIPFRLIERQSTYVEVEIHPSRPLAKNCELTLSYARCGLGKDDDPTKFIIVQIQPGTNSILRTLPSSVDTDAHTVTTKRLDRASGYAIGVG